MVNMSSEMVRLYLALTKTTQTNYDKNVNTSWNLSTLANARITINVKSNIPNAHRAGNLIPLFLTALKYTKPWI